MSLRDELDAIEKKLREEIVVWLTTVTSDGQPQSVPVWFLWRDGRFLIYSQPDKPKLENIEANPKVSLHFRGTETGGDVVILEGTARHDDDHPPAHDVSEYAAKYASEIERLGWTPESFAADYSVPVLIEPAVVRTW